METPTSKTSAQWVAELEQCPGGTTLDPGECEELAALLRASVETFDGSRTISELASDYDRTEKAAAPLCQNLPALIAHNNAAVELAHDRLIQINRLEAELAKPI